MTAPMPDRPNPPQVAGYRIARELFTLGYSSENGPCACTSACCKRGAYVDLSERDRILGHAELVRAQMDESQNPDPASWFEPDEKADADFPSGKCAGTAEINGKCAFLDKRGLCSIQVAATAAGMHKWALKPTYCILYPVEISDHVVRFDRRLENREPCCSVSTTAEVPVFEACCEELVHLLGEPGFEQLQKHYRACEVEEAQE
jgi:hypothetical protein